MALHRLSSTDAFLIVDLDGAVRADGVVRAAPKVLTDAERSSILSAPSPARSVLAERTDELPRQGTSAARRQSVTRWLVGVAILTVLTVVVTLGINVLGGNTREVQIPQVQGQSRDAARRSPSHNS